MRINIFQIPRIEDPRMFEDFTLDLFRKEFPDFQFNMNGRNGQNQHGTDIVAQSGKIVYSFQCKQKGINKELTEKEINDEIGKAKKFTPAIKKLFLITTASSNARTMEIVRAKSVENIEQGYFEVVLECWEDLLRRLNGQKDVFKKYYPFLNPSHSQGRMGENETIINEYGIEIKTTNYHIHCFVFNNNSLTNVSGRIVFYKNEEIEVVLDHNDILKYFFGRKNYLSDICLSYSFVRSPSEKENEYYCLIGNLSLSLTREIVLHLAKSFHEVFRLYTDKGIKLEAQYELENFSSQYNRVPLVTIQRKLWRKMLSLASDNDVIDGKKGSWAMFDSGSTYLKIYTQNHSKYKNGYHAFIYPGIEEKHYIAYQSPDVEVTLYLELENVFISTNGALSEEDFWGARKVHDWLLKDLIPYLTDAKESLNIKSHFDQRKEELNDDENNLNYLKLFIENLQSYYYSSYFAEADHLESNKILESLLLLLPQASEERMNYIISKVHWLNASSKCELIDKLSKYVKKSTFTSLNSNQIDSILRVMYSIVNENINISSKEISMIKKNLGETSKRLELYTFIERQQERIKK